MLFTLEALNAKHGDSLLLHYGTTDDPKLIVIDGGPAGVYKQTLRPRLEAIKEERSPDAPLPIRMLMVSHIDDDHVKGILDLAKAIDAQREKRQELSFAVGELWHNSFDDLLGNEGDELVAEFRPAAEAASLGLPIPEHLKIGREGALVLASVGQGRDLRNCAKALGWDVNSGFKRKLVLRPDEEDKVASIDDGLTFTVLGPDIPRLDKLREEWNKGIVRLGVAKAAEFVDDSVFNLSSIVVLAESDRKRMLLTGDARGDFILDGLEATKLLKKDHKLHIDLLKLPHHGSDRDVAPVFFDRITADHYVCSADGRFGNPEPETLAMITKARKSASYTIHLTHTRESEAVAEVRDFLDADRRKRGRKYRVVYREQDALSVRVDLGEPFV